MLEEEVRKTAVFRMKRNLSWICTCLEYLEEEEMWKDFNPHLVSVGNLILHLRGNMTQHILAGLGGGTDTRHREQEFTAKPDFTKAQLVATLTETIHQAAQIIEGLEAQDLAHSYIIQGFEYSGVGDVIAVVEHLSYHVGQITFAVKLLKNIDLEYHNGANLNQQNRPKTP